MSNIGKITIKSLSVLLENKDTEEKSTKSSPKGFKARSMVTPKKRKELNCEEDSNKKITKTPCLSKKFKSPPPNQKRIDNFFKISTKSYYIAPDTPLTGKENQAYMTRSRKKRLAPIETDVSPKKIVKAAVNKNKISSPITKPVATSKINKETTYKENPSKTIVCIDLTSESDKGYQKSKPCSKRRPVSKTKRNLPKQKKVAGSYTDSNTTITDEYTDIESKTTSGADNKTDTTTITNATSRSSNETSKSTKDIFNLLIKSETEHETIQNTEGKTTVHSSLVSACSSKKSLSIRSSKTPRIMRSKNPRPCPPYKVVRGTNFAVDAFKYGQIKNVTHYFLTHFHSDHYCGLTRKFNMPLYLSPLTARFVHTFIQVEEQYLNVLELNKPIVIDGIEITAIDANHCPGAIMIIFKLLNGKCILHTGDFRASQEMESEPIFWNNNIDIIYLDTTYIVRKSDFCTQMQSIDNASCYIDEFTKKHEGKKILYVCGVYVIGKEKFWSTLCNRFNLKVWADTTRRKSLNVMQDAEINEKLCDNPHAADMHIIPIGKLNYLTLVDYFKDYSDTFDILLAFRPSGWEMNSKPQKRGKINIVGVEYSEHSSFQEMKRFVMYLKPNEVISTVPYGSNIMKTSKVPEKWYKYTKHPAVCNGYQPSITSYLSKNNGSARERTSAAIAANYNAKLKRNRPKAIYSKNESKCNEDEIISVLSESIKSCNNHLSKSKTKQVDTSMENTVGNEDCKLK